MKIIKLITLIIMLTASTAAAEPLSRERRTDIENLLEITGALSIGQQMSTAMANQMVLIIKEKHPNIPAEILDVIPEEVDAVIEQQLPQFKELVIPLYARHFTEKEIKEMIQFYSTELGKKMIQVMPALAQESMVAGIQWGKSLAPEINRRIRARCERKGIQL